MTEKMNQSSAPILEALSQVARRRIAGFGGPGHDEGRGASQDVLAALGPAVFAADVLTPKGLDDRRQSAQVVQQADRLAAEAWHADVCRFSTGGSTQSLQTALLTVASPGDTVLVAQNAHRAAFVPGVIAGLDIQVIPSTHDRVRGLEFGPSVSSVRQALDRTPKAKAVLVVSPTFFGTTSSIQAIADVCHARGAVLVVDSAWGAAYPFSDVLPQNPLDDGADMMVVSVHKTMAALAQGSLILARGDRIDRERLDLVYPMLQTTSHSVPIFASLDASRRASVSDGARTWRQAALLAERARAGLAAVAGITVHGREIIDGDAAFDVDVTKVVFDVSGLGCSGAEADEFLQANHAVSVVLSDTRHCMAVIGAGTTAEDVDRLVSGVGALARAARDEPGAFHRRDANAPTFADLAVEREIGLAEAFYGQTEHVPLLEAEGRIAAGFVAPVPPEVPRLVPGQRIDRSHIAFLRANLRAGVVIDGLGGNNSQSSVRVVAQ